MKRIALLLTTTAFMTASPALANQKALKAEVAALKAQLATQAERLERLEARSDGLAQAQVTTAKAIAPLPVATPQPVAVVQAPAEVARAEPDTTIGGYGEFNYNGYLKNGSRNLADARRVVLFVAHHGGVAGVGARNRNRCYRPRSG